jgi:hypothetical protein
VGVRYSGQYHLYAPDSLDESTVVRVAWQLAEVVDRRARVRRLFDVRTWDAAMLRVLRNQDRPSGVWHSSTADLHPDHAASVLYVAWYTDVRGRRHAFLRARRGRFSNNPCSFIYGYEFGMLHPWVLVYAPIAETLVRARWETTRTHLVAHRGPAGPVESFLVNLLTQKSQPGEPAGFTVPEYVDPTSWLVLADMIEEHVGPYPEHPYRWLYAGGVDLFARHLFDPERAGTVFRAESGCLVPAPGVRPVPLPDVTDPAER